MTDQKITRDTLAALLRDKIDAQAAYSAAAAAARDNKDSLQQVYCDIEERKVLMASVRADIAYRDAIDQFLAQGGE